MWPRPVSRWWLRVAAVLHALATDPELDHANVLLVCHSRRRLANLATHAPEGPPWVWGSSDVDTYELLPDREQERLFQELPRRPRDPSRRIDDCLGRQWRYADAVSTRRAA